MADGPAQSAWRRFGASATLLVAGVAATLVSFYAFRAGEISRSERRFAEWTSERRDLLQKEVDAVLEVLFGVRALFDSSEFVSAAEFDRYTAEFITRHPHLYSLDWLPHVMDGQRMDFEARASQVLGVDYRIRQRNANGTIESASARPEYWPIYYTQARDGLARIGMDVASRTMNAAAMQEAARSNHASASRASIAAPGEDPIERVSVFLPVREHASGTLTGYVRASMSVDDLLHTTLRESVVEGIALELVDPIDGHVLGSTRSPGSHPPLQRQLGWKGHVHVADMMLDLNFYSTDEYGAYPRLAPHYGLLVAGLVVSVLGAAAAFALTRRRLHLQALTRKLIDEIAERRHGEERLSQSEARYRVLVENSPDAIMLHQEGRVRFVNDACARLLGAARPEDLVGKTVFDIIATDQHDLVRARIKAMTEARAVLPPVEHEVVRLDGSRVAVEVLAVPFETSEGVVIQVVARDITKRRAAEAARQKLEAALRHSQKLEALGTLAGGIAHDFNNILSAIIGNARLLFEDLRESHPGWESVREILNAAHRARDLVKRVAAFSRQQESQRTAVAVAPIVREVQQLLRATLPAGVELVVRMPPDIPCVLGDATQVHQVLMNLCTNAWQAMAGGRGRLDIAVSAVDESDVRAKVATPLKGAARYVCFVVHDDGVGIAPEILEHIFEPFFTTKPPGEGSGLGLAVAHGIVESHDGAIAVRSDATGTTFQIYLPACEDSPQPPADAKHVAAPGAKQHVLYIDDEEPLVFLVVRTLERAGYRCTGELEPAKAIELVRRSPEAFDLVVTDLNMPGMSGLDVARELLASNPDLPIIVTTGYIRADDVQAARTIGVRDVVLKPDTIEELASMVQSHLARASVSE